MLMDVNELLGLVKTQKDREELKASIVAGLTMQDGDIDFSDIPEVTDFSNWQPARLYLDRMREHNRRNRKRRERSAVGC